MIGKKSLIKLGSALFITVFLLTLTSTAAWGYAKTTVDTQSPSAPKGLAVSNTTYTSIALSWTASIDNVKVKGYLVYRDGRKITSTTKTSYTNTNLVPGRKYTYTVRAYDAAGNLSNSSSPISTGTISDVQNPTAPENLTAAAATHTTITLEWDSSSDNTSVKGYEIFCNGKKKASTAAAHYTVKYLSPGTAYTFYIKAYDIAGNYSGQSNSVSANTAVDAIAPSPPSGLKLFNASETEINLSWSPSNDNVKLKRYDIYRDGKNVGTTTKTSYSSKGLLPGSSYTFTVKAVDTSSNASAASNVIKASTLKDLEPPSAPAGLKINSIKGSYVSLEWTPSTDNIKVKGYQIFCNGLLVESSVRNTRAVKAVFVNGLNIFTVKAFDQSGNLSAASKYITVFIKK